jgi:hypothetical protein
MMNNFEIRSSIEHASITAGIALLLLANNANPFQWGPWFHTAIEIFFWVSAISAMIMVVLGLLIRILEKFE